MWYLYNIQWYYWRSLICMYYCNRQYSYINCFIQFNSWHTVRWLRNADAVTVDSSWGPVLLYWYFVNKINRFSEKRGPCHQSLPDYILSTPGLDPNIVDCRGRTPLHLTLMNSRVVAAQQVLQLPGCNVNVEVSYCLSAIRECRKGSSASVSLSILMHSPMMAGCIFSSY